MKPIEMNFLISFSHTVMKSIKRASMTNKALLKDNTHTRNLTMNENLHMKPIEMNFQSFQ